MSIDLVVTSIVRSAASRSWLDVRRYAYSGSDDARAVIGKLADHRSFQDAYLAGDVTFAEGLHGPYVARTITGSAYRVVDRAAARQALADAADGNPAFIREIDAELTRPRADVTWFVLDPAGLATHDAAWVTTAFAEVIAVDATSNRVDLIVCGAD